MDYNAVLLEAIDRLVKAYEAGNLRLYTEADLQSYLFHYCLKVLDEHQAVRPYPIHCNYSLLSPREKVDLTLGERDVAVVIRLEPDYPELSPSRKPAIFSEDILHDEERMRRHNEEGIAHCYLIVLDEDGCHLRALPKSPWKRLDNSGRDAYLLVKHCRAGDGTSL